MIIFGVSIPSEFRQTTIQVRAFLAKAPKLIQEVSPKGDWSLPFITIFCHLVETFLSVQGCRPWGGGPEGLNPPRINSEGA